MFVDRLEDLVRQAVGFQLVAEFQQGCRIRHRLAVRINADKGVNELTVVDRVFYAFVPQVEALLGHVHA